MTENSELKWWAAQLLILAFVAFVFIKLLPLLAP